MSTYTPPDTTAQELAVLRACFAGADASKILRRASDPMFGDEGRKSVFLSLKRLQRSGCPITPENVVLDLKADACMEEGVAQALVDGIMAQPPVTGVDFILDALAKMRARQLLYELGQAIASHEVVTGPIEAALTTINQFVLSQYTLSKEPMESLTEILSRLRKRTEKPRILKPGMGKLDLTYRIRPGSVNVIGADSGTGKTSFALNFLLNIAREGSHAAMISIEMTNEELGFRLAAMEAGVDCQRMEDGELTDLEWATVDHIRMTRSDTHDRVHCMEPSGMTIEELHAAILDAIAKYDVKCVFVDYLQRIRADGKTINTVTDKVAYVSECLAGIAKSTGVPIVALSQLNRSDGKKGMSNLKNSSQIEHDAHTILMLSSTAGADEGNDRVILAELVKNRKGPKSEDALLLNLPTQVFTHSGRNVVRQSNKKEEDQVF